MTIQPVDPGLDAARYAAEHGIPVPALTEQQFLGNDASPSKLMRELLDDAQAKGEAVARTRQHYAPGAHLRRPFWTPVADAELAALARRSMTANQILGIARAESIKAETALQTALDVEAKASEEALAAAEALLDFTKKGVGL